MADPGDHVGPIPAITIGRRAHWGDQAYLHYRKIQGWVYHQTPAYKAWKKGYDSRREWLQQWGLWEADMAFRELEEARERYCDAVYLRYSEEDLGELAEVLWGLAARAERLGPYCIGCRARTCHQLRREEACRSAADYQLTPHYAYEAQTGRSPGWPGPDPQRLNSVDWFAWVVTWAWGLRHDRERRGVGTDAEERRRVQAAEQAWQAEQAEPLCEVPDERGCLIPDDEEDDEYEDEAAYEAA